MLINPQLRKMNPYYRQRIKGAPASAFAVLFSLAVGLAIIAACIR